MKDYYTQQLILMDSIDQTLDDMLAVARYDYPVIKRTTDIEVQLVEQQCREMVESIHRKMRMIGIL